MAAADGVRLATRVLRPVDASVRRGTVLIRSERPLLGDRAAPGVMHHSDRGSQDASHTSQDLLATHGIVWSMSRKGECLDNAVAERFFGS